MRVMASIEEYVCQTYAAYVRMLHGQGFHLDLGLFKLLNSLHGGVLALQARVQHVHLLDQRVVARPVLLQATLQLSAQRSRIHQRTVVVARAEPILALVLCGSLHVIKGKLRTHCAGIAPPASRAWGSKGQLAPLLTFC